MGFTVESDLAQEDEGGSSQDQSVSQEEVSSSISPDQPDVELILDRVFADDRLNQRVQRHTDKSISNLEKDLAKERDRIDRYEAYRELGKSPEEAKREMAIDEVLSRGAVSPDDKSDLSEEVQPMAPVDVSKALKDAGYDPADATREQVEFVLTHKNQIEATNALLLRRTSQPPTEPSPSTVIPQGGKAPPPKDAEALMAELEELLVDDTNRDRQNEIKAILKNAGTFL
jgi:hypothetical protein